MNVKRITGTGLVLSLVASIGLVLGAPRAAAFHFHSSPSSVPLACGDVITKDANLGQNLVCTAGVSGLIIDGDDITLDLQQFTLTGDNTAPDTGASGVFIRPGSENVIVRNGAIFGFDRGVSAVNVKRVTLSNLAIFEPTAHGIDVSDSRYFSIRHTSVFGPAILGAANAINLNAVKKVDVDRVDLHDFPNFGVFFICHSCTDSETPNSGKVRNSNISDNLRGVSINHAERVVISENHFTGATVITALEAGHLGPASDLEITRNFIHGALRGVVLHDVFDSLVAKNQVHDNTLIGISLTGISMDNTIRNNITFGNGNFDLTHQVTSTPNAWLNNTCETKSGADIPAC